MPAEPAWQAVALPEAHGRFKACRLPDTAYRRLMKTMLLRERL